MSSGITVNNMCPNSKIYIQLLCFHSGGSRPWAKGGGGLGGFFDKLKQN